MKIKITHEGKEIEIPLSEIQNAISETHKVLKKEDLEAVRNEAANASKTEFVNEGFRTAMGLVDARLRELGIEKPADTKTVDFLATVITSSKSDEDAKKAFEVERDGFAQQIKTLSEKAEQAEREKGIFIKKSLISQKASGLKMKESIPESVKVLLLQSFERELLDDSINLIQTESGKVELQKNGVAMRDENASVYDLDLYAEKYFKDVIAKEVAGTGTGTGKHKEGAGAKVYPVANQNELLSHLQELHGNDVEAIDKAWSEHAKNYPLS